jgi:hypothetical protein
MGKVGIARNAGSCSLLIKGLWEPAPRAIPTISHYRGHHRAYRKDPSPSPNPSTLR